ncbi:33 kDa chaperonin [Commensalibacter sp. Nvir]|uniref:Hsp33 family molecular chaperone HslO n=1 Tax=Commensalibacter sp. Nvir TaxID=3069817 RepID=UPI002D34D374|nr:33 kDa chaperonin [Commensalibacter sp. Nvir]
MNEHSLSPDRPDVPNLVVASGITPFYFSSTRGRLVTLGPLANVLIQRHNYPYSISILGGEALALVAALASALKFQGSFSLQIKGEGALSLLVADCTEKGELRFYARFDEEKLSSLPHHATALQLLQKGLFALTVDQKNDKKTYQGMVEIKGNSLSEMATHYFETSEQYPCWIRLVCQYHDHEWRASALILEKIAVDATPSPLPEKDKEEEWNTALILAQTVTEKELLEKKLNSQELILHLFGSMSPKIAKARPVSYGCRCSRSRLMTVLQSFSEADLNSMSVKGNITVTCEFCHYDFVFNRKDPHA